jgi:hypothetical protein
MFTQRNLQNDAPEWQRLIDKWGQALENYETAWKSCQKSGCQADAVPEAVLYDLIHIKEEIDSLITETKSFLH